MNVPVVKIRETMVDGIVAWSCVFIVFKPVGEDLPFSMSYAKFSFDIKNACYSYCVEYNFAF